MTKKDIALELDEIIQTLAGVIDVEETTVALEGKEPHVPLSWLKYRSVNKVVKVLKESFHRFLSYLRNFNKSRRLIDPTSTTNIETTMDLIREATDRFDAFCQALDSRPQLSIKESDEYKQLFAFYNRKISSVVTAAPLLDIVKLVSSSTVIESSKREERERVVIDIDMLKKDAAYESLFLQVGYGTKPFFTQLLRAIKAARRLEKVPSHVISAEFETIKCEEEKCIRLLSSHMLAKSWRDINEFVKDVRHYTDLEMVKLLYSAIIALILASQNESSAITYQKSAVDYFSDFQYFIRQMMNTYNFQKLLCYSSVNETTMNYKILRTSYHLVRELFLGFHYSLSFVPYIDELVSRAGVAEEASLVLGQPLLSAHLAMDYEAIVKAYEPMSILPVVKVLEAIKTMRGFDPFLLREFSSMLFNFDMRGEFLRVVKMPSPTIQEYAYSAKISEEFFVFLHDLKENKKNLLIFNLQDRTIASHYSRTHLLEDLEYAKDFSSSVTVVSMTKEGDFYNQTGAYKNINQASKFIEMLLEQLQSSNSGCYFSKKVKEYLFPSWTKQLCEAIHEIFFSSEKTLSSAFRCDFIELVYLFIQLKAIELAHPDVVAVMCKDGVDISTSHAMEMFILLKVINGRPFSKEEQDMLRVYLFSTPLINRGRPLLTDRFLRLQSLTKRVEGICEEKDGFLPNFKRLFYPLYKSDILTSPLSMPIDREEA